MHCLNAVTLTAVLYISVNTMLLCCFLMDGLIGWVRLGCLRLLDHDYDGKKIKEGKKRRRRRVHRESSQSFLSIAFACGCFSSFRIPWTFSLKGALFSIFFAASLHETPCLGLACCLSWGGVRTTKWCKATLRPGYWNRWKRSMSRISLESLTFLP